MWKLSLSLLILLLPLAAVLPHETAASIVVIVWGFLVLPMCVVHVLDFYRKHRNSGRRGVLIQVIRVPVGAVGLASFLIGLSLIAWVLYNTLIERLPQYRGSVWLPSFGIGPVLIAWGWHVMSHALGRRTRGHF